MNDRPRPPAELFDMERGNQFLPAPEIIEWAIANLVVEGSPCYNPEHGHLEMAHIGALWTNVSNAKNGRAIVGQCELGDPMAMGKWAKAKARIQVEGWFGSVPDFILTFDGAYCEQCSDIEFCALVDHELLHAAQDRDIFGAPKFSASTGLPVWCIRGHDFEGFVSIAARYGAVEQGVKELMAALEKAPSVPIGAVSSVCGTCRLRAA